VKQTIGFNINSNNEHITLIYVKHICEIKTIKIKTGRFDPINFIGLYQYFYLI